MKKTEAATRGVLYKNVFLEISQNPQENTCVSLFFKKVAGVKFNKKETLAQVFSCEFCEISKNTHFKEHLYTTASKKMKYCFMKYYFCSYIPLDFIIVFVLQKKQVSRN